LAGLVSVRRACPPTVRAATVILLKRRKFGFGAHLASTYRPGASWRTLSSRLVVPKPGYCNDANHCDDDKNIHITTFSLTAILVNLV
jgi:hypothetical protein